MELLKGLQDATMEQRKAAVEHTGGEHATFLAMVLSDIYAVAKRDQRVAVDADAEPVMRMHVKQLTTLLDGDPTTEVPIAPLPASPYRDQTIAKRALLNSLLPQFLEGQELFDAIRQVADAADVSPSMKTIGPIMKGLQEAYPSQISGALVKDALTNGKV